LLGLTPARPNVGANNNTFVGTSAGNGKYRRHLKTHTLERNAGCVKHRLGPTRLLGTSAGGNDCGRWQANTIVGANADVSGGAFANTTVIGATAIAGRKQQYRNR